MSRKEEIEKLMKNVLLTKSRISLYVDMIKMWERGKTLEDRETRLN